MARSRDKAAMAAAIKPRLPLTERQAQGPPPRRKADRSKQRTYGKKGHSTASRAQLPMDFLTQYDENDLSESVAAMALETESSEQENAPVQPHLSSQQDMRALQDASVQQTLPVRPKVSVQQETSVRTRKPTLRLSQYDEISTTFTSTSATRATESSPGKPLRSTPTKATTTGPAAFCRTEIRDYIQPILEQSQDNWPQDFGKFSGLLKTLYTIEKIAEGSYGEVYKLLLVPQWRNDRVLKKIHGAVIKIVPLNAMSGPSSRMHSSVANVAKEAKLLREMDLVAGFSRLRNVHVVIGKYPGIFTDAFQAYKDSNDSESYDPTEYTDKQLYAMFEMEDAGVDVEKMLTWAKPSAFRVYDIFWSVVITLALAENEMEFEHRDLHCGNVCIKACNEEGLVDAYIKRVQNLEAKPDVLLGLSEITTTIIDYTHSRAAFGRNKDDIVYSVMEKDLFTNRPVDEANDAAAMHQYCTQISMGGRLADNSISKGKSKKNIKKDRDCPDSVLETNVIWLNHILWVLLKKTLGNKEMSVDGVGNDQSILPGSSDFSAKVQKEMYIGLKKVQDEALENIDKRPKSANELLVLADREGWLPAEQARAYAEKIQG